MKIATWNINSARLRVGLIEKLLAEAAPDILCLQEIKCESHLFPAEALAAMEDFDGWFRATVDGTLTISSPAGGPTIVRAMVPCAS